MSNVEIPKKQIGILTAVGEKKINALAAMGKQVNIAQIVVGDGDPLELDRNATDLKHLLGSIPVIYKANGVLSGGFLFTPAIANMYDWEKINEVGLVDSDGDFIGWCFFDAKAVDLFVNRVVMIRVPVISSDVSDDLVTQQQLQVIVDVVNKQSAAIQKLNDDKLDKTENSTDTNHVNGVESEFVVENKTGSIAFKPQSTFTMETNESSLLNILFPAKLTAGRVSINLQLRSNDNFSNLIISGQYQQVPKLVNGQVIDTYEWSIPFAQLTSGDIALIVKYGVSNSDHRLAIEISSEDFNLQNSAVIIESVSITGFDVVDVDALTLLTMAWDITVTNNRVITPSHGLSLLTDASRDAALDTLHTQMSLSQSAIVTLEQDKLGKKDKAESAKIADKAKSAEYLFAGDYGVKIENIARQSNYGFPLCNSYSMYADSAISTFYCKWPQRYINGAGTVYVRFTIFSNETDFHYARVLVSFTVDNDNFTKQHVLIEYQTSGFPSFKCNFGVAANSSQDRVIMFVLSSPLAALVTVTDIRQSLFQNAPTNGLQNHLSVGSASINFVGGDVEITPVTIG